MDASALADQIEAILGNPSSLIGVDDAAVKRRLSEAAYRLNRSLEAGGDSIHRITTAPLELALSQVGVQIGLWTAMTNEGASGPFTNAELAEQTKVDPVLLKRLLRYYQSRGMVSQIDDDAYAPSNITKALATVGGGAGISYHAEMIYPALMSIPKYFCETDYKNPSNPNFCPWHVGHKTEESPFHWLTTHPEHFGYFLDWMAAQRDGMPQFLDIFDFETEVGFGSDDKAPVFVDVGGAMGHQCVLFKQRFPELASRIVLQEQAHVVKQVKAAPMPGFEDIEAQAYDFWGPQHLKGARAYYLRNILHDWPDHKVKEILTNIKAGMTDNSVILIDEMVLPEKGSSWRSTGLDMSMLACLAAMERSESEWLSLIDDSGLKVVKKVQYTIQCNDCILVLQRNPHRYS
ncbi:S-adenosyl-L-methionine-dependent methyltransferase [Phaeosphaeriaceae sp. SRC1lsM3a]|nr:S-adenosyl-L-methionine-dependent methyltransferase [Stagonospora sp. SRC1lsM3a]